MDLEASSEDTASIKSLAQACEQHLKRLSEIEKFPGHTPAGEGYWASRQFAEFNLWCSKIGMSGEGHRSLDYRLKDVPEICSFIKRLLLWLEQDLKEVRELVQTEPKLPDELNTQKFYDGDDLDAAESADLGDSSLSFPSLSSSGGSEPDTTDDAESRWRKRNLTLQRQIAENIDRLRGYARWIEHAAAKHRRARVEVYRNKETPKRVYEGYKTLASWKASQNFESASVNIRERVAESFARRRIRFDYLREHQKKRAGNTSLQEKTSSAEPQRNRCGGPTPSVQKQPAVRKANLPVHLQDQGTIYSATVNTELDPDVKPKRQQRAESVASAILQHDGFPPPPRTMDGSFQCPYCRLEFSSYEAEGDRWCQHVMQDFEPYFCTVETCEAPFDVPQTFDGLLGHLQDHLPLLYHIDMPDGEHQELNEAEFDEKIKEYDKISGEMFESMKKASLRKGTYMFTSCPFCGGYPNIIEKRCPDPNTLEAQIEMRNHIKQHMQGIALFLPPYRDDIFDEKDLKSSAASRPQSVEKRISTEPDEYKTVCDREECDCHRKGEDAFEDESRVVTLDLEEQPHPLEDRDFWPELIGDSEIYDRSSVSSDYFYDDKVLRTFIKRQTIFEAPDSPTVEVEPELEPEPEHEPESEIPVGNDPPYEGWHTWSSKERKKHEEQLIQKGLSIPGKDFELPSDRSLERESHLEPEPPVKAETGPEPVPEPEWEKPVEDDVWGAWWLSTKDIKKKKRGLEELPPPAPASPAQRLISEPEAVNDNADDILADLAPRTSKSTKKSSKAIEPPKEEKPAAKGVWAALTGTSTPKTKSTKTEKNHKEEEPPAEEDLLIDIGNDPPKMPETGAEPELEPAQEEPPPEKPSSKSTSKEKKPELPKKSSKSETNSPSTKKEISPEPGGVKKVSRDSVPGRCPGEPKPEPEHLSGKGRLEEAEKLHHRELTGYEKALGPDYTSTLATVNNLGHLYSDQGRLKEVEAPNPEESSPKPVPEEIAEEKVTVEQPSTKTVKEISQPADPDVPMTTAQKIAKNDKKNRKSLSFGDEASAAQADSQSKQESSSPGGVVESKDAPADEVAQSQGLREIPTATQEASGEAAEKGIPELHAAAEPPTEEPEAVQCGVTFEIQEEAVPPEASADKEIQPEAEPSTPTQAEEPPESTAESASRSEDLAETLVEPSSETPEAAESAAEGGLSAKERRKSNKQVEKAKSVDIAEEHPVTRHAPQESEGAEPPTEVFREHDSKIRKFEDAEISTIADTDAPTVDADGPKFLGEEVLGEQAAEPKGSTDLVEDKRRGAVEIAQPVEPETTTTEPKVCEQNSSQSKKLSDKPVALMALHLSAEEAERAADGFSTFRAPLPEHAEEITGLISDFYAISSLLSTVGDLSRDPRSRRSWALVHPDVELLCSSLRYTVEDILDFFNDLDGGHATPDTYLRTWLSIDRFFWIEAQYSLGTRLAKYKVFLRELADSGKGPRHKSPLLAGSRSGMKILLAEQEKRLALRRGRASLGRNPPSTSSTSTDQHIPRNDYRPPLRQRSYERSRPPYLSPQPPLSAPSAPFSDFPPYAPEVPSSPTGSASAIGTSQCTYSDVIEYHWIKDVFSTLDSETLIPTGREIAGCFGDSHAGIKPWLLEQGFELLLQLAFNNDTNMTVYFYLRERDHRVRIVCKVPHISRPSDYYCLPLNLLEVVREGSCLQLCRRRHGGSELVLWASIQFATIESMVAFYVAFLALRSQDAGHPVKDIRDYELDGEREIYSGQIVDDDYPHALRVYRDKTTKAVRLQASVHKGEMDHTPVWTAFITSHLGRRTWLRIIDDRTVILSDLKPIILMSADDYTPPLTNRGEHVLKFATLEDAEDFLDQMEALGRDISATALPQPAAKALVPTNHDMPPSAALPHENVSATASPH